MTNYLERALEQGEAEEGEKEVLFEPDLAGDRIPGASPRQKRAPDLRRALGGERSDDLSSRALPLDEGESGAEGSLSTELSPPLLNGRGIALTAYGPTTAGLDRRDILTERARARGVRTERLEQERELTAHPGEIALLNEVQRAERAVSFTRGPQRNLTVTLPETGGGDAAGLTVETLDRAAERDARRYDGGFSMY